MVMDDKATRCWVYGLLLLLWGQLCVALVPVWRFGKYYEHGWLVAVVVPWFFWRRAGLGFFGSGGVRGRAGWWFFCGCVVVGMVGLLRVVEGANVGWPRPLLVHAGVVAAAGTGALGALGGLRGMWRFLPVVVFAMSAVPWPSGVEQGLIRWLTNNVLGVTQEVFHFTGAPVERVGDQLKWGADAVNVEEGCSGIRSLQSMLMAGLFFGELLYLSVVKRVGLVVLALGCAVLVNVGRAWWLAKTHFAEGAAVAAEQHDAVGHGAFTVTALVLYGAAAWMRSAAADDELVVVSVVKKAE